MKPSKSSSVKVEPSPAAVGMLLGMVKEPSSLSTTEDALVSDILDNTSAASVSVMSFVRESPVNPYKERNNNTESSSVSSPSPSKSNLAISSGSDVISAK